MNTSFDITDIDCAPKELEDALGVSGRTLFDPTEHPIHVDIWDGKAYVTLTEMIELEGDALCHFLAIVFPASPLAGPYVPSPAGIEPTDDDIIRSPKNGGDELELARRPLCHVAQHNRFAPIGLQAHVIRVERVAVPDHEHDVVRARTWMLDDPVRNGHLAFQ